MVEITWQERQDEMSDNREIPPADEPGQEFYLDDKPPPRLERLIEIIKNQQRWQEAAKQPTHRPDAGQKGR